MAAWDITVEGINLNTLAYQVDLIEGRRQLGNRTDLGVTLPGVHGTTNGVGTFDPTQFGLQLWVDGVSPTTGLVTSSKELLHESNVDIIAKAFNKRSGLLDLRITSPSGEVKRAYCTVTASSVEEINWGRSQIKIALAIPKVFWEGLNATVLTYNYTGGFETLSNLSTSTAPISDAVIKVHGPISTPTLTTPDGAKITYQGALSATQAWVFDCATWLSKMGTEITSTAGGSSVLAQTTYTGSGSRFFDLWSPYQVALTGAGATAGTYFTVSTRPKFL